MGVFADGDFVWVPPSLKMGVFADEGRGGTKNFYVLL